VNGKFIFGNQIPPFMLPFLEQNQKAPSDNFVPPRINKAIEFLELLSLKRRRQAAATDHQMEVIEPDDLCAEEEVTRDSALQCLAKYFDGKLENNNWEELSFQSIKNKTSQRNQGPILTRVCSCPACNGKDKSCAMCEGHGKLVFEPASNLPEGLNFNADSSPELEGSPLEKLISHFLTQFSENQEDENNEE